MDLKFLPLVALPFLSIGCHNAPKPEELTPIIKPVGYGQCVLYIPIYGGSKSSTAGIDIDLTKLKASGNAQIGNNSVYGYATYFGKCEDMKPVFIPGASATAATGKEKDTVGSETKKTAEAVVKAAQTGEKSDSKKKEAAEVLKKSIAYYEALSKYTSFTPVDAQGKAVSDGIPIDIAIASLERAQARLEKEAIEPKLNWFSQTFNPPDFQPPSPPTPPTPAAKVSPTRKSLRQAAQALENDAEKVFAE